MNPKKEERIARDFMNIFEEKKLTLAPLVKSKIQNMENPYKKDNKSSTLKADLQKNQKGNVQKDIEKMQKKEENKNESAKEVIKNSFQQNTMNKNDINFLDDDEGGLLIDDDDDEAFAEDNKKEDYKSKNNIRLGRIAIPQNFHDKIPNYNKEREEQLKEYREKVLKKVKDDREQKVNNN
jgi:hypothetical protein